jgi:PAS domain S-box-containing protein
MLALGGAREERRTEMTGKNGSHERPLVLVVDDDETIRVMLPEALDAAGFESHVAKDGLESLSAFKELRPDLVLMDVLMPRMNGFTACSSIRECPGGEYVPILMMTGLEDIDSIHRAYEVGATDFITKPVNVALLGHRMRYMLRTKQTVDDLRSTRKRLADAQRIARLGSWEWDVSGDGLRVSDEVYRIFGKPQNGFGDRLDGLISSVHPADTEYVVSRFDAARNKRRPFSFEHRVLLPDGAERTVYHEAKPELDEAGEESRYFGTAQDITERKAAEQKAYYLGLLSDTVTVIAGTIDFENLAARVVERLHRTLRVEDIGIFDWQPKSGFVLIKGLRKPSSHLDGEGTTVPFELDEEHTKLLRKAKDSAQFIEDDISGASCCAFPMIVRDECQGCLYLCDRHQQSDLGTSDINFLQTLASQLAVAMDRARSAELEKLRREKERQRLESEVKELRQVVQVTELVHRSKQIEEILTIIRRVAATDATVLVTGDSGTGKDLVSRTIHELSPRKNKPLVVVDCAAIPSSLIESELFGCERGAYTGAQQRRAGRLLEAEGGTIILDEIGELPLETQSKLLRFVQEKQVTPVGGTRHRKVDARLVAVTNRDLGKEVADLRFREDLYFRLNVVRLHVPPLHQRPDDILHLANHFLEKFSVQYQKKTTCRLSSEAEALSLSYPWPGNVRELQNRIMQAVILSAGEEIGSEQLGLTNEDVVGTSRPKPLADFHDGQNGSAPKLWDETAPAAPHEFKRPLSEVWNELRVALRRQIDSTLANKAAPVPLGRWLIDDLILEAYSAANHVLSQGAVRVGIPEATFRRRVKKALEQKNAGLSPRPSSWAEVRTLLKEVMQSSEDSGGDLLKRARNLLLEDVSSRLNGDISLGSVLMGVTVPTFRRWIRGEEGRKSGTLCQKSGVCDVAGGFDETSLPSAFESRPSRRET